MPYSAENTGIFYAPVTLADYELNDFVAVSLGLSNGQTVTYEEADELLRNDPTLTVTSQTLDYKQRFLNSMFYRAFIGWATDGIPGISGEIGADTNLPPLPGWGLKHFKLAYANNGLRILKYYDGATISGVVQTEEGAPIPNATVTLLDEGGTPHDSVVTDALGRYSVVATAGNHTLMVSMGEFGSDIERVHLTSNNILAREVGILISEAQATRATQPEIRIDIEVEAASLSGELYWDAGEREPIAGIPVTATQTATGREFSVDSGADGSFAFDAIAPGEYRVTADLNGHELELANYEGVAGLQADQSLEIDGAVVPASVLGLIGPGIGYIPGMVSFTLEDHTNGTLMQREALTSFRFDNLLPGNYTLPSPSPQARRVTTTLPSPRARASAASSAGRANRSPTNISQSPTLAVGTRPKSPATPAATSQPSSPREPTTSTRSTPTPTRRGWRGLTARHRAACSTRRCNQQAVSPACSSTTVTATESSRRCRTKPWCATPNCASNRSTAASPSAATIAANTTWGCRRATTLPTPTTST